MDDNNNYIIARNLRREWSILLKLDGAALTYAFVGIVCYGVAIYTTFGHTLWERSTLGPTFGPIFMIASTSVAGLGVVVVGYFMILIVGGSMSFGFIKFIAHLMHSKQIELSKTSRLSSKKTKLLGQVHWLCVPGIVFISALGLGWDFHNVDGPGAGRFQPILHALGVFSRPSAGVGAILFSRQLIPALVILTALAGFVPSLVLPYFGRFKVTGINASPFHISLLLYEVGILAGLGAILTLVGLVYRSLWLSRAPLPYHFGILAILGFSLHFSLGMYLGIRKAELKILGRIHKSNSGRLTVLP